MIAAGARFVESLRAWERNPFLVLVGTSGVGKTHVARCIWRWFKSYGSHSVGSVGQNAWLRGEFVLWADFIDECRDKDSSRMADMCATDHLLVIDDIGAGADARRWMSDKLYHILEHRLKEAPREPQFVKRPPRATLITANLTLEQIAEAYDQRIASRLVRLGKQNVIEVETVDYATR